MAPLPSRPAPVAFALDPRRAVSALVFGMVWAAGLVVVLDVWLHLGGGIASEDLAGLFDAGSERGLGSWVSVTQTGLIALTLWGLAALVRQSGGARGRVAGWAVLAVFVSYLALDDGTQLHERVGTAFAASEASESGLGAAFPSYYWQLVLGPVFAGMGLFMLAFLWRELREARHRRLVAGAFALLATAVGLDFVDGLGTGHPLDLYGRLAAWPGLDAWAEAALGMSGLDLVVHLSRAVEESVEIVAMTLLWAAFLSHAAATVGGVSIRWAPAEAGPRRAPGPPHDDRQPVRAQPAAAPAETPAREPVAA